MYELELFAGAGGGILGRNLLGHTTIGAVEILPYARRVLLARQQDRCLPMLPIWDDITTFSKDNRECGPYIEWLRTIAGELCISGGFPCQDISASGKGQGIGGKKSGLWHEMARVIGEIRPRYAFVENSPMLASRGLEEILASLAEMGYNARWCVLGAGHLNYPIKRDRIWILGVDRLHNGGMDEPEQQQGGAFACDIRRTAPVVSMHDVAKSRLVADGLATRKPDGVAHRVDRVRAVGNGQVPAVAAIAWQVLTGEIA